jgi:hypothetical protein
VQPAHILAPVSKPKHMNKAEGLNHWFKEEEKKCAWGVNLEKPFVVRLDMSKSSKKWKEFKKPYDIRGIVLLMMFGKEGCVILW